MRRSTNRRAGSSRRFDRRLIAAAGAIVVFGAIAGVTQISRADTTPVTSTKADVKINGLDVLATNCDDTKLELHDGFQKGNRCVTTEFGEVGSEANNPTLLIVSAPRQVNVNQAFSLKVSTRNLIRDRFLGAAAGGYYVESSILKDGLVRGHFHTACRVLASTKIAPPSDPVPDFFVATEDSKGGAKPDVVTINVPGIKKAGTVQCASWAGDGSHRIPMMQRANQTPAIDSVRIRVRNAGGGGQQGGGQQGGGQQGGGQQGGGQQGGGQQGGGQQGGGQQGGGQQGGGQQGGGQQGGNNGGVKPPAGGGANPTPTATATKSNPTTKTTIVPNTPPKHSTPAKSPSTKAAAGGGTSDDNDATDEDTSTNGGDATETIQKSESKTTTSKKTTKSTETTKSTGAKTAGGVLDADAQPDPQSNAQDTAEPAAKAANKSGLALTGTNTIAVAGVGTILLIIGLVVFTSTRRRRSGGGW